jgi:hypothetical protein
VRKNREKLNIAVIHVVFALLDPEPDPVVTNGRTIHSTTSVADTDLGSGMRKNLEN